MSEDKALKLALEALENFKEVVVAAQVLGIKVGATGNNMRLGESFLHDEAITAIKKALAPPEHHKLQVKGEHPAPCARHCEATAFQIVIKNLKAQLAQPEQEPAVFARRWKLAVDGFGLQRDDDNGNYVDIEDALLVLHHLLSAQPEQEPITWINPDEQNARKAFHWVESEKFTSAVYTTPPKREWVGLTDEERAECWRSSAKQSAINIEAKLKELNK